MAVPVLIDTDIGDDIDDALAIALAAASPECELAGVTTVFQRARLRARLAMHLLAALGRPDVPVAAGADRPLLGAVRSDWAPNQAAVLAGLPERAVPGERAVDFLIRQGLGREHLVLLPIGAMTNVALAFAAEPALAERVRVVAMAGAWDRPSPEWNVRCDPEAVAVVLAAGARVDFVGLDVTMQVRMRQQDLASLAAAAERGEPERTLLAFLRAWQRSGGQGEDGCPILHDPLAVAAAFRPDLLEWEEAAVSVDLTPGDRYGATAAKAGGSGRVRIARSVRADAFLELFGQRVCAGGAAPGA